MTGANLTAYDLKMLLYLLNNKVADAKQVKRDVFTKHSFSNVQQRIALARKNSLVSIARPKKSLGRANLYSLTRNGFNYIKEYIPEDLVGNRYLSDSIEHDFYLVNIRNVLRKRKYVKSYFTENQIQNYANFDKNVELSIFKNLRFDACFFCEDAKGNNEYFGLQYEQSQKISWKYEEIISRYYSKKSIQQLFYVCSTKTIENKIKEAESKVSKSSDKKIYYALYNDLIEDKSKTKFSSQDNKVITLL